MTDNRLGRKILLIEDDEMSRNLLFRRLERQGFKTLIAVDGEEGLQTALESHPDLILMDMTLPKMDGWELTKILKENPLTKMIPVIAITAHASAVDRERIEEVGCDAFIPKPILFKKLIDKIQQLTNP